MRKETRLVETSFKDGPNSLNLLKILKVVEKNWFALQEKILLILKKYLNSKKVIKVEK